MSEPSLLAHLGPRVAHVTAAENLPGIEAHGLLPPAEIARRAGRDPGEIALRRERLLLHLGAHPARLNHQKPILHGRRAADTIVEDHDARSWAEALDERVFFWPGRSLRGAFLESVRRDLDVAILWLDTATLFARAADRLALSPINSGNFVQGGAHAVRGNWLFVPATAGLGAFRDNRRTRGLVKARDAVREISLSGGLAAAPLRAALRETERLR